MMESIILDDGIEYLIVDTEIIDNTEYTLFTNINDETDICFRKTVIEDGERFFVGLDNNEEFEKVLLKFTLKLQKNSEE